MNSSLESTLPAKAAPRLSRDAELVLQMLQGIRHGTLEVTLPEGDPRLFGESLPLCSLQIHDESVFRDILERGDIGFAEAYLDGRWDSHDLTALLHLLVKNREVLSRAIYGSWPTLLLARIRHWLNRNSRSGSRRNIMAHYDLGNDFYRLWLDPSMTYSAALFDAQNSNALSLAQHAKYQRILQQLDAQPDQHILEIGCGWGGFAELATSSGLKLTGLTLSPAQLDYAKARVPAADLRLQDYRDLNEQFDHIVSIEMFEAVGERWWPTYFKTIAQALKPEGRAVIQTITLRDDLFPRYRRGTDFIQQYIFPGGMLPTPTLFQQMAQAHGLVVLDTFAFGSGYARTLHHWRNQFEAQWPQISALGFDETFRRLWRFYLCYCEAGFLSGNTDVVQFTLAHRR